MRDEHSMYISHIHVWLCYIPLSRCCRRILQAQLTGADSIHDKWFGLVWFYGISTNVGYLMSNPVFIYVVFIYIKRMMCSYILKGVGRYRQEDGGHGSRNPLRSV